MSNFSYRKKEKLLWELIAKIIYEEVYDQKLDPFSITISDVVLSKDALHAKIYILSTKNVQKQVKILNQIAGFIKKELAKYWTYKFIPNLVFKEDQVEAEGQKIDSILAKIKTKN